MSDPYTPPDEYATAEPDLVASGEVRSPLEQFVARLTDLGASPAEVQAVADAWDDLEPDDSDHPEAWTRARRTEFAAASDAQLLQALADTRAEFKLGTTTEAEADAEAAAAALDVALADAEGRMAGNVGSLLEWVGNDPARAEAVVRLELAPEGRQRVTLWQPLADLLGWDADTVDEVVASYGAQVGEATGEPRTLVEGDTLPGPVAADGPGGDPGTVVPEDGPEAQSGAQGPQPEAT